MHLHKKISKENFKVKTIESILKKESCQLKQIIKECEKSVQNAPKGNLRIAKKNNRFEYYYVNENDNKGGKYLKKKEEDFVRKLAQRDYELSVLRSAKERLKGIEKFLTNYERTDLNNVFKKINPYRKGLIHTNLISDEEYVKQWQAVKYEKKEFEDSSLDIITERGEYVRSKSEKIIADKLYMLGIPYRYECPIIMEGNIKIYPDFTILKMPEREEVYLEHFGMMDDVNYVNTAIYKLNTYERNGIYLGVNLFLTYETSRKPLNVRALDEMLKALWVEEPIKERGKFV